MYDRNNHPRTSRRRFLRDGGRLTAAGLLAAQLGGAGLLGAAGAGRPSRAQAARPAQEQPQPSLDQQIGQMLMVGFRGLDAPEDSTIVRNLREQHVGTVVLFDFDVPRAAARRNISSPEQLAALTAQLQAAAERTLLIAVDQEGGVINRLKADYGFPATKSAAYLGLFNNLAETRANARTIAQALKAGGINLNLAPVVDLNLNPHNPIIAKYERSFSPYPAVVAAHAAAFIEEHHAEGVLCTLKHFPGHGSSDGDTHHNFVDVTATWRDKELEPYRTLIGAGLADAVMTAHIFNGNLDPEYPATLSRAILTGLLREQLGYQGVVISDDMQMRAISDRYDFELAVQAAVMAGVDMIALANNTHFNDTIAARAHAAIRRLVEEGAIPESRINDSYNRVMALKARLG